MKKRYNANNERVKHRYFVFLKQARRQSEASINAVAKALHRFETYTRFRDFKAFRIEQAVAFKRHLADQLSQTRSAVDFFATDPDDDVVTLQSGAIGRRTERPSRPRPASAARPRCGRGRSSPRRPAPRSPAR